MSVEYNLINKLDLNIVLQVCFKGVFDIGNTAGTIGKFLSCKPNFASGIGKDSDRGIVIKTEVAGKKLINRNLGAQMLHLNDVVTF